eukprot:363955-Chlamydomonas_euryale.AAC.2
MPCARHKPAGVWKGGAESLGGWDVWRLRHKVKRSAASPQAALIHTPHIPTPSRSTFCGVLHSLVNASGVTWPATGRKSKMAPPRLLMSSTVSGACASRDRSSDSPLESCRKEMSPMTSVVGRDRPSAKPAADDTTPSMPLAPRLAATGKPSNGDDVPPPPTKDAAALEELSSAALAAAPAFVLPALPALPSQPVHLSTAPPR